MRKLVLTYGLLAGLVLAAMLVLTLPFRQQIGFDRMAAVGYASMVAAFLLVYFGVRTYRDDVAGGAVSFGRALAVGSLIVLVASACYVVTWEIVYYWFMPDFLAEYQAHTLEKLRAGGATAAQIEAQRTEMARFAALYRNPAVNVALTFLEPLPVGLLIALVSAGVLRRRTGARREVEGLARAV